MCFAVYYSEETYETSCTACIITKCILSRDATMYATIIRSSVLHYIAGSFNTSRWIRLSQYTQNVAAICKAQDNRSTMIDWLDSSKERSRDFVTWSWSGAPHHVAVDDDSTNKTSRLINHMRLFLVYRPFFSSYHMKTAFLFASHCGDSCAFIDYAE